MDFIITCGLDFILRINYNLSYKPFFDASTLQCYCVMCTFTLHYIELSKDKRKFSFYPQVYNYHTQLMPRDHTKRLQSALVKTLY